MKLLILICLVAVAFARPKLLRYPALLQNQADSSEEFINDLNTQRELQREKQSEEIKETRDESTEEQVVADSEQRESSSSSSSEEDVPNSTEQKIISKEDMSYQRYLEQLLRQIKYNQLQMVIFYLL
ncbi:alpha-S1-casein [Castor canadensis]|uniref:Alpha-S1-casein n=1 Tax=Castor canadensis TaxID=51338 RepID=A0AC58JX34_CASCN